VLHVHRRGGEHGVAGNELVELVGMHGQTLANVCMGYGLNRTRV
jgi:hypothetical protein